MKNRQEDKLKQHINKGKDVPPVDATEYRKVKVFEFPNMIARVYSPELTEEERKRRYKLIYDAAENLLKSYYRSDTKS